MNVTLLVSTYNQERYVAEAITSLLSQDYEPLTIFISDDCSTDETFAIIEDLANKFRGPHELVINRMPENTYLNHLELIRPRLDPGFIVLAHGDDISAPNRVSRLVEHHQKTGDLVVASCAEIMDDKGNANGFTRPLREQQDCSVSYFIKHRPIATCFGSGLAWHTRIFDLFGPMPKGPRNIDGYLPFRAALLGKAGFIPEALLRWRQHDANLTLAIKKQNALDKIERIKVEERMIQNRMANWTSHMIDMKYCHRRIKRIRNYRKLMALMKIRLYKLNKEFMRIRRDMTDLHITPY